MAHSPTLAPTQSSYFYTYQKRNLVFNISQTSVCNIILFPGIRFKYNNIICKSFSRPRARSAECLLHVACLMCVTHFKPCNWLTWFTGFILNGLTLVAPVHEVYLTWLSSVNPLYSTKKYTAKHVMVAYRSVHICKSRFVQFSLCTIQVYKVVKSSDQGDLYNEETL